MTVDLLPGRELHDYLRTPQRSAGLAETQLLGRPALLVTSYADLTAFMVDEVAAARSTRSRA